MLLERRCLNCSVGEYRGYPDNPDSVGTVYFLCPEKRHHDATRAACELYSEGKPAKYTESGARLPEAL